MVKNAEKMLIILISVLVAIIGIIVIGDLIKKIINYIKRKSFENEYGIKLSNKFKVKKNKNKPSINSFELKYPYWTYSNKNGTRNRVRKNNGLIFSYSTLYFNNCIIGTKSPVQMIDLVKNIRNLYGDTIIKQSKEEKNKYNEIKRKKDLLNKLNDVQNIIESFTDNPSEFEVFCAELFRKMEYEAKVTPKTNDGGFDIILNKDSKKTIVECKCYSQKHNIGRPMIQKLVGANQEIKADNMIFITTSNFSKEAIQFARETSVDLIDGKKLIELINKYYKKTIKIEVKRSEWELNYNDLQKFYPPDVNVID